jgi:UDP-N-acetylmuramate dehydrogenase
VTTLRIVEHVPLASRTTLELGGPARFFAEVTEEAELGELLAYAEARAIPVRILGGGSNLVVSDAGFDGLVIAIRTRGMEMQWDGDRVLVTAAAGEVWDAFVARTVEMGLAGLECLSGIPGLVGATPIQNVGAYGQEVSDTVVAVRVFDRRARRVVMLGPAECAFSYRDSALKRDPDRFVVLAVTFALISGGSPTVRYGELEKALGHGPRTLARVRETVLALRRAKSMVLDPADPNRRSAGSFFTNPIVDAACARAIVERAIGAGWVADPSEVPRWPLPDGRVKLAAAWLIERSGFPKGTRRGTVGVSTRHALALVHHGGGTTRELLALAEEIVAAVRATFGVELEREPVLW